MNIVPFPRSEAVAASDASLAVVQCIADIVASVAVSASTVQALDLPHDIRRTVIMRMQKLAIEACAIGLNFSEDANLPSEYASRIAEIGTRLQSAGARIG